MSTATQRLLDLIKTAHGYSDYRVAKEMGVTSSSVSRWRTGHGHMSAANVVAACELAAEKDVFRWQMFIGAERETGPEGDFARRMVDDFERAARGELLSEDSWLRILIDGLPKHAAALLVAALFGLTGFSADSARAAAPLDVRDTVYYDKSRRLPRPNRGKALAITL
jgi:transcriptional regulator with XRE-family HTH domain